MLFSNAKLEFKSSQLFLNFALLFLPISRSPFSPTYLCMCNQTRIVLNFNLFILMFNFFAVVTTSNQYAHDCYIGLKFYKFTSCKF